MDIFLDSKLHRFCWIFFQTGSLTQNEEILNSILLDKSSELGQFLSRIRTISTRKFTILMAEQFH